MLRGQPPGLSYQETSRCSHVLLLQMDQPKPGERTSQATQPVRSRAGAYQTSARGGFPECSEGQDEKDEASLLAGVDTPSINQSQGSSQREASTQNQAPVSQTALGLSQSSFPVAGASLDGAEDEDGDQLFTHQ